MSAARRRHLADSPAACLLPQIREELERAGRLRRRPVESPLPVESPGALYTYISAGGLELPDEKRWRRRFVARSPRLAIGIASVLAAIWIFF